MSQGCMYPRPASLHLMRRYAHESPERLAEHTCQPYPVFRITGFTPESGSLTPQMALRPHGTRGHHGGVPPFRGGNDSFPVRLRNAFPVMKCHDWFQRAVQPAVTASLHSLIFRPVSPRSIRVMRSATLFVYSNNTMFHVKKNFSLPYSHLLCIVRNMKPDRYLSFVSSFRFPDRLHRTAFPVLFVFLILSAFSPRGAAADPGYPSRPVEISIAFPPGGALDAVVRALLREAEKELGRPATASIRREAAACLPWRN